MKFVDSLSRALYTVYSPSDEKAEKYMWKQYFGTLAISGLFPNIGEKGIMPVVILLVLRLALLTVDVFAATVNLPMIFSASFAIFSQCIHYIMLVKLYMIVIVCFQFKRREYLTVHRAIATDFFDYFEPFEGNSKVLKAEMKRERMIILLFVFTVTAVGGMLTILEKKGNEYGTFDFDKSMNLTNGNLPFIYGYYPVYTDTGVFYYLTAFSQIISVFLIVTFLIAAGFSFINSSLNLSMQLQILLDSINNVEKRASMLRASQLGIEMRLCGQKLYADKHFSHYYSLCLKKNFQHHQEIMRIYSDYKNLYSPFVFMSYFTGTIVVALSLLSAGSFQELPGTTVGASMLCIAEVTFMLVFGISGQRLIDLNEELHFQMYSIKWYYCDDTVKRSLRIFQAVTKKPMILMGLGVIPNNLDSFAKVMNSAYSYYNLINAFDITTGINK